MPSLSLRSSRGRLCWGGGGGCCGCFQIGSDLSLMMMQVARASALGVGVVYGAVKLSILKVISLSLPDLPMMMAG